MLAIVNSIALQGLEGVIVKVEVDVSSGLPGFDLVGLPDTAVRGSKERVRAAIKNSGFEFPVKRITVNRQISAKRDRFTTCPLPSVYCCL
jgi:magnesium chelatase family protein